ncbi:Serine/threonine-protein kinase ATM [Glycine soja]
MFRSELTFKADLRDILHLRKNLLRATLCHLNWKGYSTLNEQMVLFIPRAVYALCVGHVPFTRCFKELPLVHNYFDVADAQDDSHKFEEPKHQCLLEFLDCSVEVLTEIEKISKVEASQVKICPHVRVPREISDQLLHEMETSILGALVEEEINERRLPDTFLICSLLSNLLYGSFFTRKINVSFCSKLSQYLQLMLDNAVRIIQEDSDLRAFSCLGYDPTCDDMGPLVSSIHCFLASPIFNELSDQNLMGFAPFGELIQSVERLLKAFVNLYETYSHNLMNLQSDSVMQDMAATDSIQSSCPNDSSKSRIMDMELDVNDDSREVDSLAVGKKVGGDVSSSVEKWKMGMISLISSFLSASLLTWDILFKLMEKENDPKVRGKILYHLCQHPLWSSSGKFIDLVNVMNDIIIEQVGLKLACDYVLISAHTLLTNLSSLDAVGKDKCGLYITEVETEQCFLSLGNVVHKLSEVDLNWFGRVKLIDCICNLVLLHPQIGQTMIERLLLMLKDMDYRVRLNFGVQMVVYSKGKVINAMEVLAAGPQPQPIMETVVITLMHLALHSEKIELEAVFMICVVSAIDPYHRELVCAVLDNLSRELQYRTRMKYLEQLLGSILFCWVACGVSLAALVETRHLFLPDAEPDNFLQYCCPWLLPALLINENSTDLNWVAKVTCQPLTVLIKNHFTSIFSVSMALHCSKKPGSEKGTLVLQSSILHFAQISEKERDKLIKRHMVSIVSCVLSLCSCSSSAIAPFFSRDTVSLEIQTIVDGFLDLDDNHASASVVDKINIFRPDRVFMFLVEIHYKIAAASHYRHKCHRLAGIEVLISILGQRAAVLSTSNYLINLIGSLIECRALQDQCCCILSSLLLYFKNNLSTDVTSMLGEQLQFLVSKLVACCIPSKTKESCDGTASQALSLLRMLTVDSDSSMYDYVKELEPLPELKIFDEIRKFHEELCHTYSIRDHLLKFVKKSCYLPPRLLLSSLQALQKKLLNVETFQRGGKAEVFSKDRYWHGDHEIVPAVWKLVHMCGSDDASEVRELVSDFISRVGAGDPYSVVFHLPGETSHLRLGKSIDISSAMEISSDLDACISEELLVVLLKFLMKYLMDDSVKIVDMASQTLRGILSTERGQSALQSFDSYQRSLIEVHSKGVNIELVENLLLDLERNCLRALQEGDLNDFQKKLKDSKQELVWSVSHASEESTEYIYLTIIKLQMLYHVGMAWDLRWRTCHNNSTEFCLLKPTVSPEPVIPSIEQMSWLDMEWCSILQRTQLHMNLLEPFIAFRRVLLQVLSSRDCMLQHLLQSATTLRKGCRFSQAAAALHEFKLLSVETKGQSSSVYWLGRLEEAKLFRAQSQNVMAINLAMYISQNYHSNEEASDAYRLIGKWLAETRSSNSRTILEKYLKPAVSIAEDVNATAKNAMQRKCQAHFHLAHYADALFKSHEERLNSNEWQAAMRLRKHKTVELEALIKRFRGSTKGEKTDYSMKIQELQKQVAMDKEEAQKLQDDRDNFLSLALEGYKRCLVIGNKYDVRVVFRIVSLWFSLSSRKDVVNSMLSTMEEVQSFKFIPLVYQIASRMGNSKDGQGHLNFQFALVSLVKKMAIDHPYHTILQLLALANGDRIKDKQRSRSSFVVDMDKKLAAENLLNELSSYHGAIIRQMKQMVEIYIRLAEMETKREDTNKKVTLPRDLRNLPVLELVPVVTATISIDHSCQYHEGSFPYFKGLADSVMIMNGINAPKVVECLGSDGRRYRQLAKSGNDDLRQDAVMEQFFGLVNTFLRNHQDTRKRRLGVRTYKVVPFTPSAGVLEWVNGTLPLGEYLIGSMRNGGAHGRYGVGDWSFLKCREHMANERDKRKAFQEVCNNFRPVMHYFFLERFLQPAEWFEKRLAYTRSVAASSMVGYIVGLGDRHAMNILIDQATAEVVHIDLGVAFEQGLMLKTPERVPFRLTRDIIDGMGVTGVEGVFRRCCEETLSVMRTNKEALLTIVEVFIHDPLYKWALSPLKALQRQKEMDDDLDTSLEEPQHDCQGNKDAARALLRVKQKLDGYEDGEMRSIHGQVQQLIQDAIDSERLCQMFPGWGAWL